MATLAQLVVEINAKTAGLDRDLGNLRRGLLSVDDAAKLPRLALLNSRFEAAQRRVEANTAALSRFNSGLQRTGTLLTAAITLPIVALGASVTSAAAEMDSLKRGLDSVSGSANASREQLARLEIVARLPGLGFREAIRGSINLQAAGLSANTAERALKAFGNALATVGRGKADLDGVTRALTQIASKSKVSAEEINQLNERVPQIRQAMIKAFGTADTEILGKAGIGSAQFIDAIIAQLEKLPPVAGGAANSFENLSDAAFRARVAIGERLLPVIVPMVEGLASMLEGVRTLDPNVVKWGISIAGVAAVIGPLILVAGSLATAVTAIATALSIGLLPLIAIGGPIAIGLAAMGALFLKNKLDAAEAAAGADRYAASLVNLNEKALLYLITQRQRGLYEAQEAQRNLRRQGRAFTPAVEIPSFYDTARERGIGRALINSTIFTDTKPRTVLRETREMRELGEQANIAGREIADLSKAFGALHTTNRAAASTPPIVTPANTAATDRFRGVIDNLTDSLRELATLQKFRGVASISLLPSDAQEQIRLVDSLTGELDKLEDGLKRLEAAGRRVPAGLTAGIALLKTQVSRAVAELDRIAFRFNFGGPPVTARIDPGPLPAQDRIALDGAGEAAKGLEELTRSAKGAGQAFKESVGALKSAIGEGVGQIASGSSQFLGNAIQMGSKLMQSGQSLAAAGPAALAFAAAMEIATGLFSVIGPVINALTLPLRLMGEVLGLLIVPVLRILWQPMKILGIVVSYIGEVIAKVAGAIANAIGHLVRGIGRLVNKLPGSPGDPLVKAGQAMIDLGKEFRDAAKEMEERRKALQELSFDDAVNGVNKSLDRLAESLTNVPPLFNLALRRIQAATGGVGSQVPPVGGGSAPPPFSPPRSDPEPHRPVVPVAPVVIVLDSDGNVRPSDSSVRALISRVARMLENTSDAPSRELALSLRMAGA